MSDIQVRMELLIESYMSLDQLCEEFQEQSVIKEKQIQINDQRQLLELEAETKINVWKCMLDELLIFIKDNIKNQFKAFDQRIDEEKERLQKTEFEGLQ